MSQAEEPLPKPEELLALHGVATDLFEQLRLWFDVPDKVLLDLAAVDSAVSELGDPVMIAALAMRKLQALHLLSTPGVRTTTDVVVTIVQDLDRALVQAPNLAFRRRPKRPTGTRSLLGLGDDDPDEVGVEDAATPDPEVLAFREGHARLHDAARAVVEASEGRIRVFE